MSSSITKRTRSKMQWKQPHAMHMHMIRNSHRFIAMSSISQNSFSTYAALNQNNRNRVQRNENSLWKQKQEKFQHMNAKCCETASGLSRKDLVVVLGNRMKTKFRRWVDISSMTSKSIWSRDSLPRYSRRQKDLKVRCLQTQNGKHGMNHKISLRQKQIIYS